MSKNIIPPVISLVNDEEMIKAFIIVLTKYINKDKWR